MAVAKTTMLSSGDIRIVYISSPLTGDSFSKKVLLEIEKIIKKRGYVVINPLYLPEGLSEETYMPICKSMIDTAGTVFFCEGWRMSDLCRDQMVYALTNNKQIVFYDEITTF